MHNALEHRPDLSLVLCLLPINPYLTIPHLIVTAVNRSAHSRRPPESGHLEFFVSGEAALLPPSLPDFVYIFNTLVLS